MPAKTVMRLRGARAARFAALALLVAFLTPGRLQAQDPGTLEGQVLRYGQPVPGVPVTLHRVTSEGSGEVAYTNTDAEGSFRFPLDRVEGAAFTVFFATAEFQTVRYFGPPLHPDAQREEYVVQVFDAASTLPEPPRVVRRDIVMIPEAAGSWEVNEIVTVSNPTRVALVSPTGTPTWELRIPEAATDFQAGEGDILPHEISFMGNRVLLLTPLIPGERDLFIRYRLPASPAGSRVPIEEPTDTFNLYIRQPSHLTSVVGLQTTRMIEAEGEQFLQYGGIDLPAGSGVGLQWTRTAPPIDPIVAAVSVTVLLLAIGLAMAWRNRASEPAS
jgi:5-hydroxyisourate hydrolase-like protein (transthyretin family)